MIQLFFSYFWDSYFFSYGEFGELIMKLSRAALRPLLAAHERGALPLVGAAWGVTARKASHRRSPLTRAEPCHWSERRFEDWAFSFSPLMPQLNQLYK